MTKEKVYFLFEVLDQIRNLNIGFVLVLLLLINIYYGIVLLEPDFNGWDSFALS